MALFPPDMPGVDPGFDDAAFWTHCRNRKLKFQACADCGTPRHPPGPVCPSCQSLKTAWIEPGEAELYSFTVVHYASHAAVKAQLPYVVGLATFAGVPGVKLVTNVTGVEQADVEIGMKLQLWWDDVGEGMYLPRFRPKHDQGRT